MKLKTKKHGFLYIVHIAFHFAWKQKLSCNKKLDVFSFFQLRLHSAPTPQKPIGQVQKKWSLLHFSCPWPLLNLVPRYFIDSKMKCKCQVWLWFFDFHVTLWLHFFLNLAYCDDFLLVLPEDSGKCTFWALPCKLHGGILCIAFVILLLGMH